MTAPTAAAALALAQAGELLGPAEMAAILHVSVSHFYALNNRGDFEQFKVKPAIGPRCFAGALVYRWVQGESLPLHQFGRPRKRA